MSAGDALADDDEDAGHVVALGADDLAVLDDAAEDLVGVLLRLQLLVALQDEVSLH